MNDKDKWLAIEVEDVASEMQAEQGIPVPYAPARAVWKAQVDRWSVRLLRAIGKPNPEKKCAYCEFFEGDYVQEIDFDTGVHMSRVRCAHPGVLLAFPDSAKTCGYFKRKEAAQ